jgi:hypothetical protein
MRASLVGAVAQFRAPDHGHTGLALARPDAIAS